MNQSIEVEYVKQHSEVVDLSDKWFVEAVKVVIFTSQQEMAWIFNRENFLELTLFIFYFSLVVYLDRANVIELDWKA